MLQIDGTSHGIYPMVCIVRASLTEIEGSGVEGGWHVWQRKA
jgi:hypothetical protein